MNSPCASAWRIAAAVGVGKVWPLEWPGCGGRPFEPGRGGAKPGRCGRLAGVGGRIGSACCWRGAPP